MNVPSPQEKISALPAKEIPESARDLAGKEELSALASDLQAIRSRWRSQNTTPELIPATGQEMEFDLALDTHWAQSDARFEKVLHVFHQPWIGIRAAAGYLPGHKLAIAADATLSGAALRTAPELVGTHSINTVVFHGFSRNADLLVRALRPLFSPGSLRIYAVWHGNTAGT